MVAQLHTHFDITIEILSPLHIGDGSELQRDIDFVVSSGRTWIVNHDALFHEKLSGDPEHDDWIIRTPLSDLLEPRDYQSGRYFQYVLGGEPSNRPLRSFVKTGFGEPYLPGSSLKGLLRTVFLWGMYVSRKQQPDLNRLDRPRSWAAQPIERSMLGGSPNEDLFRAIHVSDSTPCETQQLYVGSVSVYPTGRQGKGVIVDTEVLRPGTQFNSRLSIEEYGFTNRSASNRLQWKDKRAELDKLVAYAKAFGRYRLAQEYEYFKNREDVKNILRFYTELIRRHQALEDGQFLAQLGWGTGWNSKTLNDLVTADEHKFANLVQQYRLTRFSRDFRPGQPFPSSRHLLQHNGKLVRPMGWILVTIA